MKEMGLVLHLAELGSPRTWWRASPRAPFVMEGATRCSPTRRLWTFSSRACKAAGRHMPRPFPVAYRKGGQSGAPFFGRGETARAALPPLPPQQEDHIPVGQEPALLPPPGLAHGGGAQVLGHVGHPLADLEPPLAVALGDGLKQLGEGATPCRKRSAASEGRRSPHSWGHAPLTRHLLGGLPWTSLRLFVGNSTINTIFRNVKMFSDFSSVHGFRESG